MKKGIVLICLIFVLFSCDNSKLVEDNNIKEEVNNIKEEVNNIKEEVNNIKEEKAEIIEEKNVIEENEIVEEMSEEDMKNASNLGLINKYYDYLSNKEYKTAYNMIHEPGANFEEFKELYFDIGYISSNADKEYYIDIINVAENEYIYQVIVNKYDGEQKKFTVELKIVDGKLDILSVVRVFD